MSTNVEKFIADLDGGLFEEQLSAIISNVAAGVVDHDRAGEINIKLKVKKIGSGSQVGVAHTLKYQQPTRRGKMSEEQTTETPMHVGKNGALSFFPENQGQMFGKQGETPAPQTYPNTRDE